MVLKQVDDLEGFRSIVNQKTSYECEQESQDLIKERESTRVIDEIFIPLKKLHRGNVQ
jgi:hypothetical protein